LDIKREPPKKRNKYIIIGIGVLALVATTVALSKLEPAAPPVERATLWIDTVRKGTMLRQVRAPGTLVPEHIRYISAVTAGRVEAIPNRPGGQVTPQTVLMELSNPDVQLQFLEAQRQLAAVEASLLDLRTNLESARLAQESQVASLRSLYQQALRDVGVQEALDAKGLSSKNDVNRAKDQATELKARLANEEERLKVQMQASAQQIELQKAQVARMRAVAQFQSDRVASMVVRAGDTGVLTELPLELGQWVVPGQNLAVVAQPGRLKAVLRVPETQAKDVVLGQPTAVDTRNGIIQGRVMRIDPIAQNGTVAVEVALEGDLPKGARPDLSVDGTIEIERLTDVMYVGRPAYGQAESVVGLFKLSPDQKTADRVQAKLGRSSVNTIEVVQGLAVGDLVIISDMSQWDNVNKVRLK
jgi:HlyD family secretion protein